MCGGPDVPRPAPPVIDRTQEEQSLARRRRERRGFLSTLLTDPMGVAGQPNVDRPQVLGT